MPLLANLLVSLFGGLAALLGKTIVKKYAVITALFLGVAAAFGVMLTALNGIAAGIVKVAPSLLVTVASWVVPDNIPECLSARIAAGVLIWGWRWHLNIAVAAASA